MTESENTTKGISRRTVMRRAGIPAAALALTTIVATPANADPANALATNTIAGIRSLPDLTQGTAFYVTDSGATGVYRYDPSDTISTDDTGSVLVTTGGHRFKRDIEGPVEVTWFGALGDGTTDDAMAIGLAIACAQRISASGAVKPILHFPPSRGFRTTAAISIPVAIHVIMDSALLYAGATGTAALTIGEVDKPNALMTMRLNVTASGAGYGAWPSDSDIGIVLRNLDTSIAHITRVSGFGVGLQTIGDRAGFSYNEIHLGYILDNQIGVELTNRSASASDVGWCNENMFLNGRFTQSSNTRLGKARTGVRISSKDGIYAENNNNRFYKPSFELKAADSGAAEALPILIEHGNLNGFYQIRNESNSATTARILNESYENEIETGYGFVAIDDQSAFPTTVATSVRTTLTNVPALIFNSGPIYENACYYDGATSVHVPGLSFGRYSGTSVLRAGRAVITADYLETATTSHDAPAVFVDTTGNKRLVVKTDVVDGFGGRIHIVCYGADGIQLIDPGAGGSGPYVKTRVNATAPWNSTLFGGCYRNGSDQNDLSFYFAVTNEVSKVRIILWKGTAALRLRSFSVYALTRGTPSASSGFVEAAGGANLATSAPTTGTWPKGMLVVNANPAVVAGAAGNYIVEGWRKLTDGSTNVLGTDWAELRCLTG